MKISNNTTVTRIQQALYSAEYSELYARLYDAGKCPDNYVGHISWGFHPALFAEVSNVPASSCVALHSYKIYNFYKEAARLLVDFTRDALRSGMLTEDFFRGLRARLSRIVRTWDNWVRDELEEEGFFEMLEEMSWLLEYENAQRVLEVAWLLNHATLGEEWQGVILSLLSPEERF